MRNLMKKKVVKTILFSLFAIIILYLGYKTILLFNYRVDVQEKGEQLIKKLEQSGKIIKIQKNENLNEEDLVEYKNLFYMKFEDGFVLNENKSEDKGFESYETYHLNKEDTNDLIAEFKIGKTNYNLYDIFASNDIFVYGTNLKNIDRKNLLESYDLKDSYDIMKYIINNYNKKVNIFSSSKDIKMNYFMKTFAYLAIPSAKIYLIDGDYKGYIFVMNDENFYEVYLFNGLDNYFINFSNEAENEKYFNLVKVRDFISNVKFGDE